MRAAAHMRQVLEATGLYQLGEDSPTGWELEAFVVGFSLFAERFYLLL